MNRDNRINRICRITRFYRFHRSPPVIPFASDAPWSPRSPRCIDAAHGRRTVPPGTAGSTSGLSVRPSAAELAPLPVLSKLPVLPGLPAIGVASACLRTLGRADARPSRDCGLGVLHGTPRAAAGTASPVLARFCGSCPQCGADIPVCAGLRGQAGMPAPHCHTPSLRLAGTASPYVRWRAFAGASTTLAPHRPPSRLANNALAARCHCLPPPHPFLPS